jgi:glycosyltransferase involved in cell wall biosynthesis
MIHEIWPSYYNDAEETTRRKKLLAERAARVITISHNSKRDILRFLDIKPEKVVVIYPASSISVDEKLECAVKEGPASRLLYVGTRAHYKNFDHLLVALRGSLKKRRGIELLCVGGGPFTSTEKGQIEVLGLSGCVKQATLSDRDLAMAYSKAIGLVFPSQYEGFGLPILEAFRCGCPVIARNSGSIPEVAGDAAVYFDSLDLSSLERAINRILDDPTHRETLKTKGLARASLFDWSVTSSQTRTVYESVIRDHG